MNRDVTPSDGVLTAGGARAQPDFAQLFEAMPGQYMILDRDLIYVEANPAYCASTERTRDEIVGRYVFEAFPPTGEGGRQIEESLRRVLTTGVAETLPLAAYPIPTPDGGFRMKYWSCAHLPLFDEKGDVAFVAQNAVDVTELQNLKTIAYGADPGAPARGESDLFRRAQEITTINDSLAAETRGLRELFMQAPGFMAVLMGPELVYAQANHAYLQLIGHRPVIGRSLADALPEVVAQGFGDLLVRVMRDRTPHIGQATSVMLQREPSAPLEERFVDFIFQPIAGSGGESVGVFIEGSDVTDRVRGEEALRRSEEQLRLATEAAEIGLWDVDGITGALFWPASVKAMFGIGPDTPISMDDFFAGLHPEDLEATTAAYEAAVDPGVRAIYDVEYRTVGKDDGVVRWVAAKGRGVFDDVGRCVRVIGTAMDITRRKSDEARLRELNDTLERRVSEALAERKVLADIVEGTDAFVQVADLDYRWMAINKASVDEFETLFGKRPRPGENMLELLADQPEQAAAVKAVWSRALAGEEFTQVDEYGAPGRDQRWYEMKFNVLRDQRGQQIGAYQFVYDVTDRLRDQARLAEAEAALRQSQKMEAVGQLTGGIAHDFNNLLAGISGSLELLQKRLTEGRLGGVERYIDAAQSSARRAAALTQRLLAFSRRQTLDPKPTDVNRLIHGMEELIRRSVGPSVELEIVGASGLWPTKVDPSQLENALLNLCINGRDAMAPDGGRLTIETSNKRLDERAAKMHELVPGEYISICVTDTGTGMPAEVIERAFEPFFTTKPLGQGTGLGLSMIYGFVRQSGGQVRIDSELGKGATMCLYLPRYLGGLAKEDDVALTDVVAGAEGHGETVLVVDDEDTIRMLIVEVLEELGFSAIQAADGPGALKLLQGETRIDLLVTDVGLPGGVNGRQIADAARLTRPKLKVLFITGYAENAVVGNGHLAPGMEVITKPFVMAALTAKVRDLIEKG